MKKKAFYGETGSRKGLGETLTINPFASEAVYTHNFFLLTACRTEFFRKPCQHATRGCDKRWMTCIHAGVSRSPREHASVPPDKRHCRQ